jgi:hypothetical protein
LSALYIFCLLEQKADFNRLKAKIKVKPQIQPGEKQKQPQKFTKNTKAAFSIFAFREFFAAVL